MNQVQKANFRLECQDDHPGFTVTHTTREIETGLFHTLIRFTHTVPFEPKCTRFHWNIPAENVAGFWQPTADFNKRIFADWEKEILESRISVDAPLFAVFDNRDHNSMIIACSDAVNAVHIQASYREEDDHIHGQLTLFGEKHSQIESYETTLRIDLRPLYFGECLKQCSSWWENFEALRPADIPPTALLPVYSTWYQFHQELNTDILIEECRLASKLGYGLIILDDGWQTKDNNRGYDFTGDWLPERIPHMKTFCEAVHQTGMKLAVWYSVPFCGIKSKAYQKFKTKLLTTEHRWAPVFDPRYPEVREHLISNYKRALLEWNIDGFKLDFIDEFRVYPSTVLTQENGRDYASVNEAVYRLLSDCIRELKAIKPDVVIEFRQKYIGPAMRTFGHMFRAFDCPGDYTTNRVRICDLRLTSGTTAVHSDMFTYHPDAQLEVKALQLTNILFSVPQLSIELKKAKPDEQKMIGFYTHYWITHKKILMEGNFTAHGPLQNYPILESTLDATSICSISSDTFLCKEQLPDTIHIINAKLTTAIVLKTTVTQEIFSICILDCQGQKVRSETITVNQPLLLFEVPPCGMLQMKKVS